MFILATSSTKLKCSGTSNTSKPNFSIYGDENPSSRLPTATGQMKQLPISSSIHQENIQPMQKLKGAKVVNLKSSCHNLKLKISNGNKMYYVFNKLGQVDLLERNFQFNHNRQNLSTMSIEK